MLNKILITPKVSPDLDGLACAYAYSRLLTQQGKNVTEGIFGQPHAEAQYLIDRFHIDDIAYSLSGAFGSFVLVDASDVLGMPDVIRSEDVIEVIDHRESHRANELFPRAAIQVEKVGSAATQIVEKYQDAHMIIDQKSAILLYGAIYSNTLNFQASVTTERDKKAVRWLEQQVQIPNGLIQDMFIAKTEAAKKDIQKVLLGDYKEFIFNSKKVGIAQLEVVQLHGLMEQCLDLVLAVLLDLQQKNGLHFIFLTAVDLEGKFNLFVTSDANTQAFLSDVFGISFQNDIAERPGVLLRKEIVPLIASWFSTRHEL